MAKILTFSVQNDYIKVNGQHHGDYIHLLHMHIQ